MKVPTQLENLGETSSERFLQFFGMGWLDF
jgi:hypothetical protein